MQTLVTAPNTANLVFQSVRDSNVADIIAVEQFVSADRCVGSECQARCCRPLDAYLQLEPGVH